MIGRVFLGRYETTRLLGEGGMGRVFLARQVDLGRQVVVKVMHDQIAADPKFRERFERETLLMARFQHPYAVTLYDASLNDPLGPCIIMEYIRGVSLETLLQKNGRFTPARVGRMLGQLCEVLQAAHDQGIIHRDLKPANLMVMDHDTPRERIKVMDFGLAKMLDPAVMKQVTDTNTEFAVGTPGYISPEQIRGGEVDHRADLYSVGVILYEMLSARLPFNGPASMDMLLAHATEPPPPFEDIGLADWIPPHIEAVVFSCMAKDPADRPACARDLAERYEHALKEWSERPEPEPVPDLVAEIDGPPPSGRSTGKPFAAHFESPSDDPHALLFKLEAWMPEAVAMVKLRGFVHDMGGDVLQSIPGLIKVKVVSPKNAPPIKSAGPLSWLGISRRPEPLLMEIRLTPREERENLLRIEVLFRSTDPHLPATDPTFRARCVQLFIEFRGYLIG